jgi:Exo70 exocyst complex subunit
VDDLSSLDSAVSMKVGCDWFRLLCWPRLLYYSIPYVHGFFLCFVLSDFDKTIDEHKELCVIDPRLRDLLQKEVASTFLPLYRDFYEKVRDKRDLIRRVVVVCRIT